MRIRDPSSIDGHSRKAAVEGVYMAKGIPLPEELPTSATASASRLVGSTD